MEIKINPQFPGGARVSIIDMVLDDDEQAIQLFKMVRAIQQGQKLNLEDSVNVFRGNPEANREEARPLKKQIDEDVVPKPQPQLRTSPTPPYPPRARDSIPFEVAKEMDRMRALEDKEWLNDDGSIRS